MKFSADRLKNIDWKQFGVNHGEKIALGFVGLLVIMILFMGTRWSTFKEKDPEKLLTEVDTQSKVLVSEPWPVAEQEAYTDKYNVNIVYDNTYSVVVADKFRYPIGHPMIWPLHRQQEPIQEPVWLAVQDLIATPGRFILKLPAAGEEAVTDAAVALIEEEKKGPMSRVDAIAQGFEKKKQTSGEYGTPGSSYDGADPGTVDYENGGANYDPEMYSGEMGSMAAKINARGVRFIAVRGVFPYRKQVEEIVKARHNSAEQNPRRFLALQNFEIQRQKAKPGPDPWSDDDKDWTTLDQKIALDVLAETENYAEDIVDYTNTDYVITSPLPMRLVGDWSYYFVGHPKVKTMTQRQLELRRLLDEELVKLKQEASVKDPLAIGGFADAHRNMSGIQSEVWSNTSQKQQLLNNMTNRMKSMYGGEEGSYQMPGEVTGMLNSSNEMPENLLFRYFDFDVKPGEAYRYRVRLKVFNPNFGELPDNLVAANVGAGESRETAWSDPTPIPGPQSILQEDSNFFVGEVLAAKTNQEPKAKIDLYQWLSEIGTTANKVVEVKVGQLIGQAKAPVDEDGELLKKDDKLAVEVLRPYQSFKAEAVELATNDAVVDLAAPVKATKDYHSDLKVRELKPLSQVLIVNEFGELENRNPLAQSEQHAQAKEFLALEYKDWEALKKAAEAPAEGAEGMEMYGEYMSGSVDDLINYGSAPTKKKGGKAGAGRGGSSSASSAGGAGRGGGANPSRRNRPSASSSAMP